MVPLAPTHPVGIRPSVEPMKAALSVQEQPEGTLRGSLSATSYQSPPGKLLEFHWDHSGRAVLFDEFLKIQDTHVEILEQQVNKKVKQQKIEAEFVEPLCCLTTCQTE